MKHQSNQRHGTFVWTVADNFLHLLSQYCIAPSAKQPLCYVLTQTTYNIRQGNKNTAGTEQSSLRTFFFY